VLSAARYVRIKGDRFIWLLRKGTAVTGVTGALAISAALLMSAPPLANATPVTYEFTTPGWTYNESPAIFGTGLNLSITVDNGGTSSINQSFQFSNILSVAETAVGGSLSDTATTATGGGSVQDAAPVITTDGTAQAVNDLISCTDSALLFCRRKPAGQFDTCLGSPAVQ
jgi:hypothetical protein